MLDYWMISSCCSLLLDQQHWQNEVVEGVHVDHGVHVDGDVGSDHGDDVVHVDHESCHWTVFETLFETLEYVLALVALVAERKIGKMAAAA